MTQERYDVGGVVLPRPFRIRRLGHFALTARSLDASVAFYRGHLGLMISDMVDYARRPGPDRAVRGVEDARACFMRHSTDHHSLVLFGDEAARRILAAQGHAMADDVTIHHIPWECGSVREVAASHDFLVRRGVTVLRAGRYMPGSNWFVYFIDPDGHLVELYHGLEQVGWEGRPKPEAMHDARVDGVPTLPRPDEAAEIDEALERGVDLSGGLRDRHEEPPVHDVEGTLLPRPFSVTGIGPVKVFVRDLDRSASFYTDVMGLVRTEETTVLGERCVFLRAGTEHHSMALIPRALAPRLDLPATTTLCSFGLRVGSYSQLCGAVTFLTERGCRFVDLPPDLSPGVDHCACVVDPDGHAIQLHHDMEQIGWDGKPRPTTQRISHPFEQWLPTLDPD